MATRLRKCVSLGDAGTPFDSGNPSLPGDPELVQLYGRTTLPSPSAPKGYDNLMFLEDTNTQWVRLFVSWHYMWPNPPAPLDETSAIPYPAAFPMDPVNGPYVNIPQVYYQLMLLDANILAAKNAKKSVILTTVHYPKWLNQTSMLSPSAPPYQYHEQGTALGNGVLPPDNVLLPLNTTTPPEGRKRFIPTDFMYHRWINFLIYRYHRNSPEHNPPYFAPAKGTYIDALELVNEPNISDGAGATCSVATGNCTSSPSQLASRPQSTVLMMRTAQKLNQSYNKNPLFASPPGQSRQPLKLLGPALAGYDATDGSHPKGSKYDVKSTFTYQVIHGLVKANGGKPIHDSNFGWSHHNYEDVEMIGNAISRLSMGKGNPFSESFLAALASLFYGQRT